MELNLPVLANPFFISYPGSLQYTIIDIFKTAHIHQKIFLLLKIILVLSLIGFLLKKEFRFRNQFLFLFLISITILFFRLPNTILPEQNIDESVYITGAGVMLNDPAVWKSFDCLTVGPIHSYLLSISYWIFGSINYASIRLLGILFCSIPSLFCLYFALNFLYGKPVAYCISLGYGLFNAVLTTFDFIGYSSELFPHFLLSLEFLCFSAILAGRSINYAYVLCFIAGMMPYAKLQAVLIAGLLVVFLFIEIRNQLTVQRIIGLIGCGLVPSVILLVYLYSQSLINDFYQSYLLFNIEYSGSLTDLKLGLVPQLIIDSPETMPFFVAISLIILCLSIYLLTRNSISQKRRLTYSLLILFICWYSIIKPGQSFNHYLIFLFYPVFWTLGIVSGEFQRQNFSYFRYYSVFVYSLFFLLTALTFTQKSLGIDYLYSFDYKPEPVVSTIQSLAKPADRMSIWGHGNLAHLHCYTFLLPGTRDVFASRQINPSSLQSYFIARYKKDLDQNRPRFIVEDNQYATYQTHLQTIFPALLQFYRLHSRHGSINLYVRKNNSAAKTLP
ncbi:hypothetical protein [Larkinella terrae]|uniref:Glycosyltransferase RgtA/B/C/D-like domain-containing protein n=1 Tax=Larkinella terrae TaxID=2025311 RepID=A0A7K0EL44_9BACT|nr:hypothetical protein [Larkinella terrae]MRS62537.1 hypothetical protein [Larkinella terrae]